MENSKGVSAGGILDELKIEYGSKAEYQQTYYALKSLYRSDYGR